MRNNDNFSLITEDQWIITKPVIDIKRDLVHVNGLESNSTSPSDQWIVKIKHNEAYETMFLKLFITSTRLIKNADARKASNALQYESNLYQLVLSKQNETYFPKFFCNEANLSYEEVVEMIAGKVRSCTNRRFLSRTQTEKNIIRNLHYMINYENNRPGLSSIREGSLHKKLDLNIRKIEEKTKKKYTFGFFAIEAFPSRSKSLYKKIRSKEFTLQTKEFWECLLQITQGLQRLHEIKIMHNDLHYDNIMIVREPVTINVQGKYINCKYRAIIFDFDRAYCCHVGSNKINDKYYRENHGIQNRFNSYLDTFFLFACLSAFFEDEIIIRLLTNKESLISMYREFCKSSDDFRLRKIRLKKNCFSYDDIIKHISLQYEKTTKNKKREFSSIKK